jgi:DNA polymerase-3 subunit beta
MKLTISREILLELLSSVIGAVEKRHTSQILENILIKLEEKSLTVLATDLEIELSAQTEVQADIEGNVTVPARKFFDICKALPKDSLLNLSLDKNKRLVIRGARSRFVLATLPAEEFPLLDNIPFDQEIQIHEKNLRQALDATAFTMANQDVRYYLNGMLFDITADSLATVATDGHRLALHKVEEISSSFDENSEASHQIILPRKGVLELSRVLKTANDTEIKLQISSNHIRVQTASVRFTSKLIDGRYPDYKGAIPITFSTELNLDRLQFKSSLQRASILSNEKFKGVKVSLSNNLMVIESNNPEQETAKEEIDISYSGESFDIGFNVTYLLDAINHLKGETAVLCLNTTESSVLLFDPENEATRYIVMPIKL